MLEALFQRWGRVHVWSLALAAAGLAWIIYSVRQKSSNKATSDGEIPNNQGKNETETLQVSRKKPSRRKRKLKIFYGTQTGKSKAFAQRLAAEVKAYGYNVELVDMKTYDPEENLAEEAVDGSVCVFLVSTYTGGKPPEDTEWFFKWLEDTALDFRVQKTLLSGMCYAVFGLGNSLYKENFNVVGRNLDSWLQELSAIPLVSMMTGDENTAESRNGGIEEDFLEWKKALWKMLKPALDGRKVKHCKGDTCSKKCENCKSGKLGEAGDATHEHTKGGCSSDEEIQFETSSEEEEEERETEGMTNSGLVDVEDLGKLMELAKTARTKEEKEMTQDNGEPREMITPLLRESLEKQGYRLIGSHSGVKLCRWTKSMLRGRGGCYKHTFYGIESHRCVETTPSLACANKCVFCWRHHTNPVGTEWKWKMDDPKTIFDGALKNHVNLVKQFKGVPGVKPERLAEALEPQHCALSLVGEPIMYPEINAFVTMLHEKGISSFLVTNAQFPDAIRALLPVTQLYVSVDAATKESLKKIDRPLFRDYWERFLDSLKALSEKQQRTVYRLTLVKGWNTEELDNYASLISIGNPDFIEVKGVTYCGESKASNLTMVNVPWHEEVVDFVKQLAERLPEYELASEHEHSNCLLLANKRFKVDGEWWTWINYPKFHALIQQYTSSNGAATFASTDYMAKTPAWAVYGATEQGFDPVETRFYRKKQKDISGC
ncbi:S-adenosyl-L-methionine-dependent tRNA 4-demethylwyosine synthase-like [Pomacea canaliculata]|nr:S-adenosyl-L-methionine-dependent tRNA 4-demethylwyosine synthase-like [Pomacea canaliculata]XP_025091959.1 S-adenosyl-L-methionine-dependent tRNA 4-demethylwyosine synthase-like [Pomacea canaliculata]XP_025091960.1 S-adenosyl-L-methionine-dependent tRNA 4-demethylwyosine synthase-like [Pomacea canaliculata]